MIPGIYNCCRVLFGRLLAEQSRFSRMFATKWQERQAALEEQMPVAAPKVKKRIKYKKPDWITDKVLFVANFPKSATQAELLQFFSQVGFATEFRKFENVVFGWCIFENKRHADRARRELHGATFQGQRLVVFEGQRTKIKPIPEVVATC